MSQPITTAVAAQMIPGGSYIEDSVPPGHRQQQQQHQTNFQGQNHPQGAPPKSLRFRDKKVVYEKLEQFLKCGECQEKPADWDCKDCQESYCDDCKVAVHSKGPQSKRQQHNNFTRLFICRKCGNRRAIVECEECEGRTYCDKCNKRVHGLRGRYRGHQSIESIQLKYNTDPKKLNIDRDEENGFNIIVKQQLTASRFPSEHGFIRDVIFEVLQAQKDPRIRTNMARALSPGLIEEDTGPSRIDINEVMSELKRLEGHRPPEGTPPPQDANAAARAITEAVTTMTLGVPGSNPGSIVVERDAEEVEAEKRQEEVEQERRRSSHHHAVSLPSAEDGDGDRLPSNSSSRPQSAIPENASHFLDTQTQKLSLDGGVFQESCVGWRRLSRLFEKGGCFFGPGTNTSGNTNELKRLLIKEKSGPKMRTASSFASAAQLAPPQYSTAGLSGQTDYIPRFVDQEDGLGVLEDGFNLGLLPAVLNMKCFKQLFLSLEAKDNKLFFFQFWTLLSKRDGVLERDALTKVQNLLITNAQQAPVSPAVNQNNNNNNNNNFVNAIAAANAAAGGGVGELVPVENNNNSAGFHHQKEAEVTEKKILTVFPKPDTRARVPEIPGGILSPSAQDEVFLQSPTRTRQHRAPEAFVPANQKELNATSLTQGFLQSVYQSHRVPIATDDMVPIGPGGLPLFGLTENLREGESWKILLMKAYAKMYGNFGALNDANPVHVLKHMTGGVIVGEEWGADVPFLHDPAATADYLWWKIRATRRFYGSIMLFRSSNVEGISEDRDEAGNSQSAGDSDMEAAEQQALHQHSPHKRNSGSRPTSATSPQHKLPRPVSPNSRGSRSSSRLEQHGEGGGEESATAAAASGTKVTQASLHANVQNLPVPEIFPAAWGTEACAFERGNTAESDGGAVALFTRELLNKDANRLGVTVRPQPSGAQSWALTKLFQFGGGAGAERFSFSANSPHWTKELRDYFDFRDSDNDLLYATPQDMVTAFDTIVTCFNFPGAANPCGSFRLIPTPQQPDGDWTAHFLVALKDGSVKMRFDAEVYDFKRGAPVAAAQGLNLHLRKVHNTARAALHPLEHIDDNFETIEVGAVQQLIPALGHKITLPDKFEVADLVEPVSFRPGRASADNHPQSRPQSGSTNKDAVSAPSEENSEENSVGGMFVLTVTGAHRTDMLSGILSFHHDDVLFCTAL